MPPPDAPPRDPPKSPAPARLVPRLVPRLAPRLVPRLAPDWFARARLKLRHLQLLAALDELRNLNRAARSLGLTQPAASKLLAEVEQMMGEPVFERRPRGMEPNACGLVLLRRARMVLVELELAAEELNGLRSGVGGLVSIGAVTAPAVDSLVRAVELAQRRDPALQITVEVDTSPPLIDRLRQGRLDFALARIPQGLPAGELDYREVGEEALCFLVREDHPLLSRASLSLAELVPFPWVLQPPGSLLRQEVELLFARHGLPWPQQVLNSASILLSLAALERGDCICVVSAPVADIFGPNGRFRRLPPLPEVPQLTVQPYGLIRLRGRPLSPAAAGFYALLEGLLFNPEAIPGE